MPIRFSAFPQTQPPPSYTHEVANVFQNCFANIGTEHLEKGLDSDAVLAQVRPGLLGLGFQVELNKTEAGTIRRPVFFGENGKPGLQYRIDAYHPIWNCGLEIEAGRALLGNAVYRDLVQALVMVEVTTLFVCVSNAYRYESNGKVVISEDYKKSVDIAQALYGHSRIKMPYQLVIIGY